MTSAQINQAIAAGIISKDQGWKMLELFAADGTGAPAADGGKKSVLKHFDEGGKLPQTAADIVGQENLRFLRDFNDIFIAIGVGILGFDLFAIAGSAALPLTALFGPSSAPFGFIIPAIVMWILAEFFGGKNRQHLPTLLTALFFVMSTTLVLWGLFSKTIVPSDFFQVSSGNTIARGIGFFGVIVTSGSLLASIIFYWRFRFPFCVYLIAASAVGVFYSLMIAISPDTVLTFFGPIIFLSGLISFVVAVWYDQKDLTRLQRFSDNAFWLHLIAAPLILSGTMLWKFGFRLVNLTTGDAVVLLTIVAILAILGLAVNRRALLVSALVWTAIGLYYIFDSMGNGSGALILTLIVLGSGVIFLGVAWGQTRNFILKFLPRTGVWQRIFPPEGAVLRGRVADY